MSNNREKTKVVDSDGEKDDESERRDIVHGLPALSVITTGESSVVVREEEEEEAVVVAGELAKAWVEEMVAKGKNDESGEKESRPKKMKTDEEEVMGSGKGEMINPKKNAAGLTHLPPKGSPEKKNIDSSVAGKEKEETCVNEQAIVAAQLVIGALEEALVEEKIDCGAEIKSIIPRNLKKTDEATDSLGKGIMKRQKRKATVLSQLPPEGSSVCKVCGKWFKSHNALCGHMKAHRHTPFQGSLPPEFIEIVEKGVIHRQNAHLVRVATGGEISSNSAANERASVNGGTDSPGSKGGKGLSIDLNVKPLEEVKESTESASVVKFDLNKSPPKDKEEEETESAADVKFDLNKSPPNDKEDEEKAK